MPELFTRMTFFGVFLWIHIASVVLVIGGMFGLRYLVLPMLAAEEEPRRRAMLESARRKLVVIIPVAIGLLIVSGLVNLMHAFSEPPAPPVAYHILFGVKMIFAFAIFIIALMLVLPSNAPNAFQRKTKLWSTMIVHLGFLVIAMSVALHYIAGGK